MREFLEFLALLNVVLTHISEFLLIFFTWQTYISLSNNINLYLYMNVYLSIYIHKYYII